MCKIYTGVVHGRDFFEEGVYRQENAYNVYNAKRQFDNSCKICVCTNKHMNCAYCPIKGAYEVNIAMDRSNWNPKNCDRTWIPDRREP